MGVKKDAKKNMHTMTPKKRLKRYGKWIATMEKLEDMMRPKKK